jgi:hypothetical protein
MGSRETVMDDRLATDAEKVAIKAFSLLVGADEARRGRYATQIADVLGNHGEFHQYVSGSAPDRLARIDRLLHIFHENVELLINKTWVEKSEQKPKDRLIDDLATFEKDFREGAVLNSFRRFVALANSLASLLFGHQSKAEDFIAYCFRIEPKFGLFFWYVGELEKQAHEGSFPDDLLTLETLLGVYVLSCF